MSTRCNIIIKQTDKTRNVPYKICLYRHSDGYPEGAGEELFEYLNSHELPDYAIALAYNMQDCTDLGITEISGVIYDTNIVCNINSYIHSDIEFLYVIDYDARTLTCYDVPFDDEHITLDHAEQTYTKVFTKSFKPMTPLENYLAKCQLYTKASNAYYKDSKPIMSDEKFDKLQMCIRAILKEHPEYINSCNPFATPQDDHVDGFNKVTRTNPMLSLRDIYTREEVETWWNSVGNVPVSVEAKLDGLSLSLIYEHGKLVQASTRGTGYEGDDVTAQALNIENIPNTIDIDIDLEIRGEVTMPIATWKAWNASHSDKEQLANPRNAASGALKSYDTKAVIDKGLQFNAYYLFHKGVGLQIGCFTTLDTMGFDTLPHQSYVATTLDEIMWAIENVQSQREQYDMQIDGVVLKVNDLKQWAILGNTDKFHKFGIAFKFKAEAIKSKLLRVVWQVAESGRVTPVAEYEPIEMFGTTCQRATLNNIGWIKKNLGDLRIGDTLLLTKGGDIIPKITGVEHREPTTRDLVTPQEWEEILQDHSKITQISGIVTTPTNIGGKATRMDGAYLVVDVEPKAEQPKPQPTATTVPDVSPSGTSLNGKTFYITGTYYDAYGKKSPQRRKELQAMVVANGGKLQDKFLASRCDYLVCGDKAGSAKITAMQSYCKGDNVITEQQFLNMI